MSLKYRNASGVETPVAGLNGTSGELIPSTALLQSGVAAVYMPNTSSLDQLFTVQVTFDTPFEDDNYVLNVDQCEVSEAEINRVFDKTASGFYIAVMYNRDRTTVPSYNVSARIPWQAFKLMTDEVHEADAAAIAALQAVVPSSASSSNKLVPVSDTIQLYTPATSAYSTWDAFLELLHQKGSGIWSGRAYLNSIWWSYLVNIQAGQSGYWLGSGIFKAADTNQLIGVNKAYSTTDTWTRTAYAPAPLEFSSTYASITATVSNNALYRVTIDKHMQDTSMAVFLVGFYGSTSKTMLSIADNTVSEANPNGAFTLRHTASNTVTITDTTGGYLWAKFEYLGAYN